MSHISPPSRAQENQTSNFSNAFNISKSGSTEFRDVKDDDGLEESALTLYLKLTEHGFVFSADGEKLRWRGPTGVLTDAERAAIPILKAFLLKLTSGFCVRASYDPVAARQYALSISDHREGAGVRSRLLGYAARAEASATRPSSL